MNNERDTSSGSSSDTSTEVETCEGEVEATSKGAIIASMSASSKGKDALVDSDSEGSPEPKLPEKALASRSQQIRIRAKSCQLGAFVPRSSTGKPPKGSCNVKTSTLSDTSEEEEAATERSEASYTVDETLQGPKLKVIPIADINSSFDDLDISLLEQEDESEARTTLPQVNDSKPAKRITFNPCKDPISGVVDSLLLQGEWRSNAPVSYTHLTLPTIYSV